MSARFTIAVFVGLTAVLAAIGDVIVPAGVPAMVYDEPLRYTPPCVYSIEDRIIVASIAEGLPPSIALDQAWRESRFLPGLVSSTGDHGVMQLNERYFPAAPSMTTPENIFAGVHLLSAYWQCYGDARLVHEAYNRGPRGKCRGD